MSYEWLGCSVRSYKTLEKAKEYIIRTYCISELS